MRVAAANGQVLTYDTDDVEDVKLSTPHDVIDITEPEDTAHHRKLGQAHLHVTVDFKPGKKPLWIGEHEEAKRQLASAGEILTRVLNEEGIPADLASRIWNRYFFGNPAGLEPSPEKGSDD